MHFSSIMALIYPFLLIPVVFISILSINWLGHFSHTSSEQIRVDAVVLSLCHQRKNFLHERIHPLNMALKKIEISMDAAAAVCFGGIIDPGVCEAARLTISGLSLTAKTLEMEQDRRRLEYPEKVRARQEELLKKNALAPIESFKMKSKINLLSDGLNRQLLDPHHQGLQDFFQIPWPKLLIANENFEGLNRFEGDFQSQRKWIGPKNAQDTHATRLIHLKLKAGTIVSACSLNSDSNLSSVKVSRDL